MHSDNDYVTTGQVRIKGHISAQFVLKHCKQLLYVISMANIIIKQQHKWLGIMSTENNFTLMKYRYPIVN